MKCCPQSIPTSVKVNTWVLGVLEGLVRTGTGTTGQLRSSGQPLVLRTNIIVGEALEALSGVFTFWRLWATLEEKESSWATH